MAATYGSFLLIFCASALVGQAVFAVCGRREWSWLSPAVGLAALMPIAWWTVRLPGEGAVAAIATGAVTLAAAAYVYGRLVDARRALRVGLPVALPALLAASLPFIVEARFGILGTGLNPDMSQHLFAADRLAAGASERLIADGYPLGPHAVVVAVAALGPSLVHAFDGLTLAIAVSATLAPLALFEDLAPWRRVAGSLLVGFAYMVASYLVQGAFKETIEAMIVLAFAIGLHEVSRRRLVGRSVDPRWVGAVPLAVLAVGAVYAYSFPGILWLAGAAVIWALAEAVVGLRPGGRDAVVESARMALPSVLVALGLFIAASLPELGRMIDFADFETFDPSGPGLGNLFNPISPLEALGIWPSGDFRLDPGDGFAPAAVFWLGAALGAAILGYGLHWWLRRGELAVPAALAAAVLLYLYAHFAGTPYQEAKAIALASPLVALIGVRAVLEDVPSLAGIRASPETRTVILAVAGAAFVLAARAAACSLWSTARSARPPIRRR